MSVTTPGVKEASVITSTTWFEGSGLSLESEGVHGGLDPVVDTPDLRLLYREEMRSYRSAVGSVQLSCTGSL